MLESLLACSDMHNKITGIRWYSLAVYSMDVCGLVVVIWQQRLFFCFSRFAVVVVGVARCSMYILTCLASTILSYSLNL